MCLNKGIVLILNCFRKFVMVATTEMQYTNANFLPYKKRLYIVLIMSEMNNAMISSILMKAWIVFAVTPKEVPTNSICPILEGYSFVISAVVVYLKRSPLVL